MTEKFVFFWILCDDHSLLFDWTFIKFEKNSMINIEMNRLFAKAPFADNI